MSKICPPIFPLLRTPGLLAECSVFWNPHAQVSNGPFADSQGRCPVGCEKGRGRLCSSEEDRGEGGEQLHCPAAHHTLASATRAGGCSGAGCQDTRAFLPPSGTQACVKVNAHQLLRACFLQREGRHSEHLIPSPPVCQNADFIFAFYELERRNSFPWYNMTLWRKSCPNTFRSQILSLKRDCTELK